MYDFCNFILQQINILLLSYFNDEIHKKHHILSETRKKPVNYASHYRPADYFNIENKEQLNVILFRLTLKGFGNWFINYSIYLL